MQDEQERAQALARVYDSAKSEDDAASDSCCSSPREEATGSHASSACSEDASDDEAHSGPGTPAPAKPSVRGALGSPKPHPSAHVTWWDQAGGAAPDAATLAAMAADLAAALRRLAAAAAGTAAETGAAGGFAVRTATGFCELRYDNGKAMPLVCWVVLALLFGLASASQRCPVRGGNERCWPR